MQYWTFLHASKRFLAATRYEGQQPLSSENRVHDSPGHSWAGALTKALTVLARVAGTAGADVQACITHVLGGALPAEVLALGIQYGERQGGSLTRCAAVVACCWVQGSCSALGAVLLLVWSCTKGPWCCKMLQQDVLPSLNKGGLVVQTGAGQARLNLPGSLISISKGLCTSGKHA
jgi:hypothetical protein